MKILFYLFIKTAMSFNKQDESKVLCYFRATKV